MTARLTLVLALSVACLCGRAQAEPAPAPTPAPATAAAEAAPEKKPSRLNLDSRPAPLGGALKAPALWQSYKARFVTEQGRVVDTGNNLISHSEGQGYGMLLAVAANDRPTFDRIFTWTRANLLVRDDYLVAWRWEPRQRPAVADTNNATDGDLLIAWALAEAAEYWGDLAYRFSGRRIASEAGRKLVLSRMQPGAVLLPAISGFHRDERADGPVVNLSYYVFPAFSRLSVVAPEADWSGLTQGGLAILDAGRTTPETLPPDWMSLKDGKPGPAEGLPYQFAYNAVRVPLYMAWAGVGEREHYAPFMALVKRTRGALAIVDVANNNEIGKFGDSGIGAIGALIACVVEGAKAPPQIFGANPADNYYPATMHLLALLAMQMRYPSCLR